jgi:hypothetical protein
VRDAILDNQGIQNLSVEACSLTQLKCVLAPFVFVFEIYYVRFASLVPFHSFQFFNLVKDAVNSVLRISSGHNKGRPADINIAKILHLSDSLN